jgi:hypothetical protein
VLSARIAPSSNVSVLAAPIACAAGLATSASASAASLCGIVTLTPRKPAAGSARTVSSNSSGGSGSARYCQSARPAACNPAFCIAGEREWATGHPQTPR